eukprot:gnl/TRDRNA2_/TRDRNA2_161853_c3_seq1.p1 gnl/TRDRNA2_/TRDRNA2_161853_c3~~gnl/TRDRNA2_/TRDRNA2_161853_c3_seq1.p1  ORF type:complete len:302 (-),score=27.51 gnl/TRDRNA2_/TRDRNA2_161853_c3_seq1:137-982(-)
MMADDVVFTTGDVCGRMLFIERGRLTYILERTALRNSAEHPGLMLSDAWDSIVPALAVQASAVEARPQKVHKGMWVSEAVLWTIWEHSGRLSADSNCYFFSIDAQKFADVISRYEDAKIDAVLYAREFLDRMNEGLICTDLQGLGDKGRDSVMSKESRTTGGSMTSRNSAATGSSGTGQPLRNSALLRPRISIMSRISFMSNDDNAPGKASQFRARRLSLATNERPKSPEAARSPASATSPVQSQEVRVPGPTNDGAQLAGIKRTAPNDQIVPEASPSQAL